MHSPERAVKPDSAPTREPIAGAVHGPYEDLAIALVELFVTIIQSQPKEVQAELWRGFLEDMKGWRDFWGKVSGRA